MKKITTLICLICIICFTGLSIFSGNHDNEKSNTAENFLINDHSSINPPVDTFVIAGIYALGRLPYPSGEPDTIQIFMKQQIPNTRKLKVNITIVNDSLNGTVKQTFLYEITNNAIYDTILYITPGTFGEKQNDLIIVQALKGEGIIHFPSDTLAITKMYHYQVTRDSYNHADSSVIDNGGTGFGSSKGNLLAAFRNRNSSPVYVSSIDHCFFENIGKGFAPYKIVVYGDNGAGKPGSLLYISSALTSPMGTGSPQRVIHNLSTPVSISPGSKFYVGYRQTSALNLKAAYQDEDPVRTKSFFYSSPDTSNTWYDFHDSSKSFRLDISAIIQYGLLNLTVLPEGFYSIVTNKMVKDTARVYLRNNSSPHAIVDSSRAYLDSNGFAKFYFTNTNNSTPYYIDVSHRNSIRTWSSSGQSFTSNLLTYNFTTSLLQAYGGNMKLKGSKFCIFSGECDKNGTVSLSDIILVFNASSTFTTGYVITDLDGDNLVNLSDLLIVYNNSAAFVQEVLPP